MEYRRLDRSLIIRLDPGDEIVACLKTICQREDIRLGTVNAIGAVNRVQIGLFQTATKEYHSNTYQGDFEICSLMGTVSTMAGETYLHLHITVGDIENRVLGGHLNEAVVSATCEIVVQTIAGEVDREFSDAIGLNILKF
jgi:predicted DNA-binding protein with PD1-like motif